MHAIKGTHVTVILQFDLLYVLIVSYHIGMYIFIWTNALDQQQPMQLEANYIYDGMFPVSPFPGHGRYLAFLAQKLYLLSSQHCEYPNAVTSLANTIYNSISKIYINSLQLMQWKRAQYCQGRSEWAHP